VELLSRYEFPTEARSDGVDVREKKMHVSPSSTQGIVENLLRLMDIHSRKWHPRSGTLALRLGDCLVPVNVGALRKFLVDFLKENPTMIPGCLQPTSTSVSSESSAVDPSLSAAAAGAA
jgi:hypothetical protein